VAGFYQEARRVMDVDDDDLCYQIANETMGANRDLHEALQETTLLDGIWFHTAVLGAQASGFVPQPESAVRNRLRRHDNCLIQRELAGPVDALAGNPGNRVHCCTASLFRFWYRAQGKRPRCSRP
jgi:hypothetical protein